MVLPTHVDTQVALIRHFDKHHPSLITPEFRVLAEARRTDGIIDRDLIREVIDAGAPKPVFLERVDAQTLHVFVLALQRESSGDGGGGGGKQLSNSWQKNTRYVGII